ncbi:hypothetical protein AB0F17_58250 [Nonomuraea sp. NPDC026600]|uniref:hypothetical protein n=1 Tax=Nonomuraea sp. NPDC026600 TaxID=3155363 RepID=UPI0033F88AEB
MSSTDPATAEKSRFQQTSHFPLQGSERRSDASGQFGQCEFLIWMEMEKREQVSLMSRPEDRQ